MTMLEASMGATTGTAAAEEAREESTLLMSRSMLLPLSLVKNDESSSDRC